MKFTPVFRSILVSLRLISRPDLTVRRAVEQPASKDLVGGEIVIVGEKTQPKWAVLKCPGGCGNIMRLPLRDRASPRWSVTADWLGRATATPSVHQKNACRAHYWIKRGRVVWCKDSWCGPSNGTKA